MMWRFLFLISVILVSLSISLETYAYTFTPGPSIAMTGSSDGVFFSVREVLYGSGITDKYPTLETATETFSGAFYLSGAGWVLFDTGSYRVDFNCSQSLSSLTTPCTLSGTAWGEMIGDVIFEDGKIQFDPYTALLSGTMSTYVGDYSLSGIILPLLSAEFSEGTGSLADHAQILSISGSTRYYGTGSWNYVFWPTGHTPAIYSSLSSVDLSHASDYTVEITDPNGSRTLFSNYRVSPNIPSISLDASIASTIRQSFCNASPALCPDGATLESMSLIKSGNNLVANGKEFYHFRLRIRDRYGNMTSGGKIEIGYVTETRANQVDSLEMLEYPISFLGSAVIHSGSILDDQLDGRALTSLPIDIIGDVTYSIASIAPTSAGESMSLSGILYTDALGVTSDITQSAWETPLIFTPWYSSLLSVNGDIIVGSGVEFSGALTHASVEVEPTATALYHIQIGPDNLLASFKSFQGDSISCTKYSQGSGSNECNWFDFGSGPVIVSTPGSSFSGLYTPTVADPPLESVSYESYITYVVSGTRVLYPSTAGSLGGSKYGQSALLILGQNNVGMQYNGLQTGAKSNLWNTIRKSVALLSRNRTNYDDVDYLVSTGSLSIVNASFASKRSIIVIGADVTITGNIVKRDRPLSIIALADEDGIGGNIRIDPIVTDIEASLFAEHSVLSSGDSQLYIHGSLISANTTGDTLAGLCPYYVKTSDCSGPSDAEKYDFEKIRGDYLTTPGFKASSPTALAHPEVALIIEYDGRILSDPPPGVGK